MMMTTMRRPIASAVAAVLAIAATVAMLLLSRAAAPAPAGVLSLADTGPDESYGWWHPPPQDVGELVRDSELIVFGRVGSIVDELRFAGYDERGGKVVRGGDDDLPWVDYRIDVLEVLKGRDALGSARSLIYRMADSRAPGQEVIPEPRPDAVFPMPQPGEEYLFFLNREPDPEVWSSKYHAYARVITDGAVVRASDGRRTAFELDGRAADPAEFVRQVRASIAQQQTR